MFLINGEMNLTREEKKKFSRKRALISKAEKNIEENIITSQVLKGIDSLKKLLIVQQGKNDCKFLPCKEGGHCANECKNRKNNKLIKTLESLDYVEINK